MQQLNVPFKTDEILAMLATAGVISETAQQSAASRLASTASQLHPISRIGELGLAREDRPGSLSAEALTQWLAHALGMEYQKLDPLAIDVANVTQAVAYAYAARAKILPIALTDASVTFAVCEPGRADWQQELQSSTDRRIETVLANPADIERYLVEFYALARSIKARQKDAKAQTGTGNVEHLTQLSRFDKAGTSERHIVGIADWLLQFAFEQRASDIHLEPRREAGLVRFRIDGILHQVYQMPPNVMTEVSSRLKILARLDVAEKRRPQDGRIKTRSPEGQEIELRLSSMPTAFGEKLVLRVFDPDTLLKDYQALGLSREQSLLWRQISAARYGIVLVTGPTGSGKTTTLYSTLRQLATEQTNVCTIEDPIELVEPSFNQMQVNPALELSFASGIRTMLRQDPDIIMVGETRDLETADSAIQAALTGHLVLTTLHTNDAPSAITRLLDLGVPEFLIRATVVGVMAQRLIRRLCPHCKQAAPVKSAQWRALGVEQAPPREIFHAVGCLECRASGYLGRIGLYELMNVDESLRPLIRADTGDDELRQQARAQGMRPLRMAAVEKLVEGQTSLEEVLRVSPPC